MRLDIADLRLFLCVVDAGSITQGAIRANLALASASERLRAMEADAGVRLLERRQRGVAPTEAGDALAHHARRILSQQSQLRSELRDYAAGARGTLHLYANTAALTGFLPPRLAAWLAQRPDLRVELKERASVEIVAAIAGGLAEAGIVSDAVPARDLRRQAVARDHLALIVPPDHPMAQRAAASFAQVLDEPFVGLPPGSALQEHLDGHARAAGGCLDLRIRMQTFDGVCHMVSQGVGVAILPRADASRLRRRHAYRTLALSDAWARRRLCLCYRDWNGLSAPMRSLLEHLGASPEPAAGV